jgi:hypothetical protein
VTTVPVLAEKTYRIGNFSHSIDTGSIQIATVFSRFDEEIILYIFLHLVSGGNEVIFTSIDFLVAFCTACIYARESRYEGRITVRRTYVARSWRIYLDDR